MKLSILLVLAMSSIVMADMSGEQFFKAMVFLTFASPIGWGVLILLIIGIVKGICKGAKAVASTDYSKISEEEKREKFLDELGKK